MNKSRTFGAAIAGLAAITAPALAGTRDDVVSGIERCAVIHDNRVWLDCVYGAVQPMRAQLGLQPAPEFQQRLVPSPQLAPPPAAAYAPAPAPARTAAKPRPKVGFWRNLLEAPPVTVSRMSSYSFDKTGGFLVTLENGQQWRQIEIEGGTARWTREPSAYEVTISQGTFGTYYLHTGEGPQAYKVKQEK